ncbi:MAG TPA: TRAP transporter small permease subunit, partial [Paracoccaceae bacterium]|nr:TRAP transporter small permease subunit [Paracoccaceae bacterium]
LVVFGGMALCDKLGGHIAVDVFERSFPPRLIRLTELAGALLGALVFAGIAWTIYESAKISLMLNLATNVIGLPKVYFQWAVCVFAAVTALAMLLRALDLALRPPRPHPHLGSAA